MKKNIIVLLSLLYSLTTLAQLGVKHWIPPLFCEEGSQLVEEHLIYLSTPSETPFSVKITDGSGVEIPESPVTISKGNPASVYIGTGEGTLMFVTADDIGKVLSNSGLILSGKYEFYCSFRVRSLNQAETLISKGSASLGTQFRAGSLPMSADGAVRNFVTSFMATENNTTVTISDYNPDVVFGSSLGFINDDVLTVTLNAGESYILTGNTAVEANLSGFVGALLTSDKNIVVNTGNALGGMNIAQNGQDFNLDQIVGYDKVGNEYLMIRGNGSSINEQGLVIATQDNTSVYVNGSNLVQVINEGEYLLLGDQFYQGISHKNMYITSDKPVYLYQILAGSTNDATSGLNFIPPLSCFFQKEVDMIPDFNRIYNFSYNASVFLLTKTGSSININDTAVTVTPETVSGNPDWVTYRLDGYTGNLKVNSTGPLAVGVFGASGNAGYAGYYSGFGVQPKDTDIQVCSSKESIDLLEAIEGNPEEGGVWTPALSGGGNLFDPATDAEGTYNYSYTGDCEPVSVNITVHIVQAPDLGSDTQINICNTDAPFDLFDSITGNPVSGGVWVPALQSNTNIFNPAVDPSGDYKYTLYSDGVCDEAYTTVSVVNQAVPVLPILTPLKQCDNWEDGDDTNGSTTFDLSLKTPEIVTTQTNWNVTYHTLLTDAQSGINPITTLITSNTTVYVRVQVTGTQCFTVSPLLLEVLPVPNVPVLLTFKQCDDDTDGFTYFNLKENINYILGSNTYTYQVYETLSDAETETNPVTNLQNYYSDSNTVYAVFTNALGCTRVVTIQLQVSVTTIPASYVYVKEECDDYIDPQNNDFDGITNFDFSEAEAEIMSMFPSTQPVTIRFYKNLNDALAEINPITSTSNYRNVGYPNQQFVYVRVDNGLNNECLGLGPHVQLKVKPVPDFDLGPDSILCVNPVTGLGTIQLNANVNLAGSYTYEWTPTNPLIVNGLQNSVYNVTTQGTYQVKVTNTVTGCSYSDAVTVTRSSEPGTIKAVLISPLFADDWASIQVTVSGYGTYQYSLDGIVWQSSPIFTHLAQGKTYVVYVKDSKGCGFVKQSNSVTAVYYPKFFTPNGDQYNPYWTIKGLLEEHQPEVFVFDRYGKLLLQFNPITHKGWDGDLNGKQLPANDYWFRIDYTENGERKSFRNHFSLLR